MAKHPNSYYSDRIQLIAKGFAEQVLKLQNVPVDVLQAAIKIDKNISSRRDYDKIKEYLKAQE